MSLVRAAVVHVARADLGAVAAGVGDGDGAVVAAIDGDAVCASGVVAAEPQLTRSKATQLTRTACVRDRTSLPLARIVISSHPFADLGDHVARCTAHRIALDFE